RGGGRTPRCPSPLQAPLLTPCYECSRSVATRRDAGDPLRVQAVAREHLGGGREHPAERGEQVGGPGDAVRGGGGVEAQGAIDTGQLTQGSERLCALQVDAGVV